MPTKKQRARCAFCGSRLIADAMHSAGKYKPKYCCVECWSRDLPKKSYRIPSFYTWVPPVSNPDQKWTPGQGSTRSGSGVSEITGSKKDGPS